MKKLFYSLGVIICLSIVFIACETTEVLEPQTEDSMYKASKGKVKVCHSAKNGDWKLINISVNALPAHLAHGDMVYFPSVGTFDFNYYVGAGTYAHTMIIDEVSDGTFSGHGYYILNSSITWDLVDGTYGEDGNVTFTIIYTGTASGTWHLEGMFTCGDGAGGFATNQEGGTWDAMYKMD